VEAALEFDPKNEEALEVLAKLRRLSAGGA
jgi:hypothetical protein